MKVISMTIPFFIMADRRAGAAQGGRQRALRWLADQTPRPRPLLGISLNILAPAKIRLDGKRAAHCAARGEAQAVWPGLTGRYPASRGGYRHGMATCTGKHVAGNAPDWAPHVPDMPRRAHRRFPRL
ncbi:hypothetical protein [Paraburkholderia sp. DGU8]|uniref:hypothetical protein n=1 Tax=Paraburkholderia sp. DGU8 TaxID=3161997 RepID=UPI0034661166